MGSFGLGLGVTYGSKFSSVAYSPLALFASGAPGVWYDPSDMATLFQDAAGTTPVTAVEQPVGLMLDKSRGLVLGSELVDTANSAASWIVYGTNTVTDDDGGVKVTFVDNASGAYLYLTQAGGLSSNLVAGKSYKLSLDLRVNTGAANFAIYQTSLSNYIDNTNITTSYVTRSYVFTYSSGSPYVQFANLSSGESVWIRNISVRELPGSHATQSTSASRPVLSARYNLLTYTEQFDNAAWTKTNMTVTANTTETTDPLGGNTADILTDNATTNTSININPALTVTGGDISKFSVALKYRNNQWVRLLLSDNSSSNILCWFDLQNGVVGSLTPTGSPTNTAISITSLGNGWYRCTAVAGFAGASRQISVVNVTADGSSTRVNNGSVYIWGADLRVSNDGVGLPSYQRVTTSTDYDTTGFPLYLRFDGTDDSMATSAIDFTGTDKMSVFAGVRKLSDAAVSQVLGLRSASVTTNLFEVLAPSSTGNDAYFISWGSNTPAGPTAPAAAPTTKILTALGDISGDVATLRLNGVQVGQTTFDQGTGNYSNAPLFLGARGGSSLWFNGRDYGLVVLGRTPTAAEIANTENYMEAKTFGKDMNYVYVDQVFAADGITEITAADGDPIYMSVVYE